MDPERAQTHLRLLAEAELRHASAPNGEIAVPVTGRNSARLARVAQALIAVGALDAAIAEAILADFDLAITVRQPRPQGVPIAMRPPGIRRRLARYVQATAAMGPQAYVTSAAQPGPGRGIVGSGGLLNLQQPGQLRPAEHVPDRSVPVGMMFPLHQDEAYGELYLLAYSHTTSGARFSIAARLRAHPHHLPTNPAGVDLLQNLSATDDRGNPYTLGFSGGGNDIGWTGVLDLHPTPPAGIRWLELSVQDGTPHRISLESPARSPAVTVTEAGGSPGDHYLNVVAARLLTEALNRPAARAGWYASSPGRGDGYLATGLGDVVDALTAAGTLSPLSQVPGQLATLCESLAVPDHGITATPAADLPKPWLSLLTHINRRKRSIESQRAGYAGAAVTLPQLDGVTVSILGLHSDRDGTMLHVHASGLAPGELEPASLPVLWLCDGAGRWHVVSPNGWQRQDREVTAQLRVLPPLTSGSSLDVIARGRSAEVRATLRLTWR